LTPTRNLGITAGLFFLPLPGTRPPRRAHWQATECPERGSVEHPLGDSPHVLSLRSLSAPAPHSAAAMVMSRLSSPMASWKRCSVFIHKGKVTMVATAPGFPPCIPATGPPAPAWIQGRSTNRTPADAGNSVEAAPCARSVARGKTQLTSGSRQAVNRVVTSTERGIG
jgi:hypothetical protein